MLSINLGLINLAPIPALDGGRVVFILVEAVRKKPVKIEFQGLIHYVGFVVLIGLLLFVTYRDIARLLP